MLAGCIVAARGVFFLVLEYLAIQFFDQVVYGDIQVGVIALHKNGLAAQVNVGLRLLFQFIHRKDDVYVNHVVEMQPSVDRVRRQVSPEASESEFHPQAIRSIREEHRTNPEPTVVPLSEAIERPAAPHVTPQVVTERLTYTERVEMIPRLVTQENAPVQAITAPPSLITELRAEGRANQMPQDSAEPPIQVTIGSIEVTAVAAAPAAKRQPAARQPAMSLQDYLARRQGKGASS